MSYHRRQRALSGVSTVLPIYRRPRVSLGSLGDDTSGAATITTPTLMTPGPDPATAAWQGNVLAQLQAGVATMQKAELQKWLQIAATVTIPLSAALWKLIFKKGVSDTGA